MARELRGEGENSQGQSYDWQVVGFGQLRGGRWYGDDDHDVAPSDATMRAHLADPNWGMVVRVTYPNGATRHMTIVGAYDPDVLDDIIDLMVEDYG